MHIMEGYLPAKHCLAWGAASAPFFLVGVKKLQKLFHEKPQLKLLLGAVGGFAFVLSALKIPSWVGSCSHPTGVGLGAVLFGPWIMSVVGTIVLLFQALLLAHGGMSTLGANAFSMAIVGPWVSYGLYWLALRCKLPFAAAVFIAATLGDLATYAMAAVQLAAAHPDLFGGFSSSLVKFMLIYAPTQLPLAISEGLLTVLVLNLIREHNTRDLEETAIAVKGLPA